MNQTPTAEYPIIIKRDGAKQTFSLSKIKTAILKAFIASGYTKDENLVNKISENVVIRLPKSTVGVEQIQDIVEEEIMKFRPDVAKKYIIYREWRNTERSKRSELKQIMDGIVSIDKNDINLSNANMSSHTPAGQMMTFASEITKDYAYRYLLPKDYAEAHKLGDIHIHDLDYFVTKTSTCIQYDLEDLFNRGFHTKNGSIRTPQSIQSYATLATIVFQTNQNEQHGGQAIPAFDFFMAPGVYKTYIKHLSSLLAFVLELKNDTQISVSDLKKEISTIIGNILPDQKNKNNLIQYIEQKFTTKFDLKEIEQICNKAYNKTRKDTHQAMEGFIHNLNTMHSRGGNQVVFSSINYGTDFSAEGRMVMEELMNATIEGLGKNGEVPVFPIQIFKIKDGISFCEEDFEIYMNDFESASNGKIKFKAPNFDLFIKACATTAKALFPNFMFLDSPFNQNEKWDINDPKRYKYELATMGCRTRVYENIHGEKTSLGRGNLSFTTMNLPRLAIEAMIEAKKETSDKEEIENLATKKLYDKVRKTASLIAKQLHHRYRYQRTALARQFPFMLSNNIWKGGEELRPNDTVGDVINSGTLGIGFIGGHNAMMAIHGEGHGVSEKAWNTLYHCVEVMNDVASEYKEKYNLNYSVLATPAEGLSGRFTRMDRKKYGTIQGVNDREYYINSFHVDVHQHIKIIDKIKREAPFHAITKGGHITYVELDGEAKKNIKAIAKIVKVMKDENIGYGSINHPIDTCRECNYKGVIYDHCPICDSEDILRMRRITGYLTGDLSSWNSAKKAEEKDRVKHS